eukprot:1557510-Alexandrium_andersonii.AAC.1
MRPWSPHPAWISRASVRRAVLCRAPPGVSQITHVLDSSCMGTACAVLPAVMLVFLEPGQPLQAPSSR